MLMVAIGRSLLIFSDVTFKMAAWFLFILKIILIFVVHNGYLSAKLHDTIPLTIITMIIQTTG